MENSFNHYFELLNKAEKAIKEEFGSLSKEELNKKPNANSWSIAECIEHLVLTMESYFPHYQEILEGNHSFGFLGKVPFLAKFFGKVILNSVEPNRQKKIKTFPVWDPAKSEVSDNIIAKFSETKNKTIEYLKELEPKISEKQMIASPANRKIVYPFEYFLKIITDHNFRHISQGIEVKKELNTNL